MSHTIVLIQFSSKINSRTYSDFDTLSKALDGIVSLYEKTLVSNDDKNVTYDISQLFSFIDSMHDLSCLVLQKDSLTYKPHDSEWIKTKV